MGTLLPIVVGMILINRLSPTTVFLAFGLFYLMTGFYYRLPIPVQPLKAVGAIAIAYPNQITESVIGAGGILFGLLLLVLSLSGMVDRLAKLFTQPVVRGIQLALGLIFLKKGIELIVTQKVFLSGVDGKLSEYPINLVMGFIVFALVLALLDNKKCPAALAALAFGIIAGLALGGFQGQSFSIGPTRIGLISPSLHDFWTAFIMLILPQVPLTIGNACVGTADMCSSVFPNSPLLSRTKAGRFALTMGLANLPAGLFGAVPMCHGTGGLAAHYRFGARTGGAPVMIGVFFVVLATRLGGTWPCHTCPAPEFRAWSASYIRGIGTLSFGPEPPEQRGILRCPSHRGYRPGGSQYGVGLRDWDCGRHLSSQDQDEDLREVL